MRHVGEEFALGLAGVEGAVHGALQFLSTLADALFEKLLMLANFFLRGGQRLNHTVEAFAEILDFVAGAADLDRLEMAFPYRRDAGFEKREGAGQEADGEARNCRRCERDDAAK